MDKTAEGNIVGKSKFDWTILCLIVIMLMGHFFLYDLTAIRNSSGEIQKDGTSILAHNDWDSYTIQAMAWRENHLDVDEKYLGWLELAEYNGKCYVSFPPFPSVVMLPFTFIFGYETPSNLIIVLICVLTVLVAYQMLLMAGTKKAWAAFLALFYVWGSNMLAMSLNGGVWFMAQAINMLLCTLAFFCCMKDKRVMSYIFVALAVGCRPFSFLIFAVLFVVYLLKDLKTDGMCVRVWFKQWKCWIAPAIIGICYMTYNFLRFDNPMEFGHNYLAEFVGSEHGQFSTVYLWDNLKNLLFRGIQLDSKLHMNYTWFNGFLFYVANPIFILVFLRAVVNLFKKEFRIERVVILLVMFMSLLLTCCHKTLGGWQFGARYMVDLIPLALLYMLIGTVRGDKKIVEINGEIQRNNAVQTNYREWKYSRVDLIIAVFGIMFNVSGAIKFWFSHFNG